MTISCYTGTTMKCAICIQTLTEDHIQLSCHHDYCTSCIQSWCKKQPTCPLCRKRIFDEIPQYYHINIEVVGQLLTHLLVICEHKQLNLSIANDIYIVLIQLVDMSLLQLFETNIEENIETYNESMSIINTRLTFHLDIVDVRYIIDLLLDMIYYMLIKDIPKEQLGPLKFILLKSKLYLDKEMCNVNQVNKNDIMNHMIDTLEEFEMEE